ncbi:MAG: MopE-related protein, partial [Chitinophagales bacterium]|nr:MopE-related protein [Chitinophagales bacterium]MDW8427309.1 MopE-related protein [Chitinophagales bacterium]
RRMRVREAWSATQLPVSIDPNEACTPFAFGETEDYILNVIPPNTSFTGLPTDMCEDASPVQIFPANPSAVISGPGIVSFGGNYYFDPATAGAGTHTITCSVGSYSSSQTVTVHPLPTVTMCSLPDMCDIDGPVALTCGTPAGGIYLGTGVYDDGFGNYFFDPSLAGAGSHVIIYLYSDPFGCSGFDFTSVNVNASSAWYADVDGDTYGDPATVVVACTAPAGYVSNNQDCDDTNPAINPAAAEVCANGIDDNCNGQVDENDVAVSVTPAGPMTLCGGVPVTLSASASGLGTITYQWYRGLNPQSGATAATYTTTKKGTFYVVVSNGICTAVSNLVSISRIPAPPANITNLSGTNDLCAAGGTITLKANGTSYTYQWKKDGSYLGQTTKFVTVNTPGNYTVEVTNSSGCTTESAVVSIITNCRLQAGVNELSVYPNPSDGSQVMISGQLPFADDVLITLNTLLGQEVLRRTTQTDSGMLQHLMSLPEDLISGTYLLRVVSGETIINKHLVVQK